MYVEPILVTLRNNKLENEESETFDALARAVLLVIEFLLPTARQGFRRT